MRIVLEVHARKRQDKKMKAPTDIASNQGLQNLVVLWRAPDVDESLAHPTTSSTSPQSRNQRQNPESYALRVADIQKSAPSNTAVLTRLNSSKKDPKRLVARKRETKRPSWFCICWTGSSGKAPFLVGVYDLVMESL